MSTYKRVLNIEKKYNDLTISNQKEFETNLEKYRKNLKIEFENKKNGLKENFERNLEDEIEKLKIEAQTIQENSKKDSMRLKNNADVDSVVKILVSEVKKNV